jgi:2-deoxy-D-gluconate 3-dehydrogenase
MENLFSRFRLDGRAALVTGGAGLLGSQFCRTLAQAGAAVAVLDLDLDRAEAVAAEIRAEGRHACAFGADVGSPESLHQAVRRAGETLGDVEVLVNCAAKDPKFDPKHQEAASNAFEDFLLSGWEEALKVNLTGTFLATQAVVPSMLKRGGGAIINICSTYGLVGPDQKGATGGDVDASSTRHPFESRSCCQSMRRRPCWRS